MRKLYKSVRDRSRFGAGALALWLGAMSAATAAAPPLSTAALSTAPLSTASLAAAPVKAPRATRFLSAGDAPAVLAPGAPPVLLHLAAPGETTLIGSGRDVLSLPGRLDHALLLPLAGRQVVVVTTRLDAGDKVAFVIGGGEAGLRVLSALPQDIRRGPDTLFLRLAATPDFRRLKLTFNGLHGREGQEWSRLLDGDGLAPLLPVRTDRRSGLEAWTDGEMARVHAALSADAPRAVDRDWLERQGVIPALTSWP